MNKPLDLLRPYLFLFTLFILSNRVQAQSNFYKWSAGINVGPTITSGDAEKKSLGFAYAGAIDYYFTPYMNLGFEMQAGQLRGGEIGKDQFVNNYKAIAFNGRLQLGQFLNDDHFDSFIWRNLKGIYVGSGLGAINNRAKTNSAMGKAAFKNTEIFMPVNVGLNINIQRRWQEYSLFTVNINYLTAVSFEDGMDGYYDIKTNTNDVYSFFSIGLRYNFGNIGLDMSKRRQ